MCCAAASHKPESPVEVPKRTLSVEAAGPHLAGLEMIPEPKDQLDLTLLAEHILDTLQHGDELVEQQVGGTYVLISCRDLHCIGCNGAFISKNPVLSRTAGLCCCSGSDSAQSGVHQLVTTTRAQHHRNEYSNRLG